MNQHRAGPLLAVVGTSTADAATGALAEEVGSLIAGRGGVLLCGGLGGVMEAAARGACLAGGLTVGILPGDRPAEANSWVRVPVATGLGFARNAILARAAEAVVAIGKGYGTLSEMALALRFGTPVVALESWHLEGGVWVAGTPEEAVSLAFEALARD
jgi:uncharacterized protein (TIGR00725 family)